MVIITITSIRGWSSSTLTMIIVVHFDAMNTSVDLVGMTLNHRNLRLAFLKVYGNVENLATV